MNQLPEAFRSLQPFADTWAKPTENERSAARWSASPEDFQAFYDAALPLLPAMMERFENEQPGAIPENLQTLYWLALAFAEVAPHVELYDGASEVPNSFAGSRFVASHGERAEN